MKSTFVYGVLRTTFRLSLELSSGQKSTLSLENQTEAANDRCRSSRRLVQTVFRVWYKNQVESEREEVYISINGENGRLPVHQRTWL